MSHVAKVKINSADYRRFEEAAEAAGTSVDLWLTEAGRAHAIKKARVTLPGPGPLDEVWREAASELSTNVTNPQHRAYLRLCQLRSIIEDTALLTVPDAFTQDVIESRLRPQITDVLSRRLGRPLHVAVTIR